VAGAMVLLFVFPIASPAQSSGVVVVIAEVSHVRKLINVDALCPLSIMVSQVSHIFLIE
jgi:hypothetical protein